MAVSHHWRFQDDVLLVYLSERHNSGGNGKVMLHRKVLKFLHGGFSSATI